MDWLVMTDWTHLMLAAPLVGLALATATTDAKPPDASADAADKGDDAKTGDDKADDGKAPDAGDSPPPRSEEERLEIEQLRRQLEQRKGNEARLRDRLQKERQKTAGDSGDQPQGVALGAKDLAELVSTTVAQTLSSMGVAKAKSEEPIPGLERGNDGSYTYFGEEISPTQVRLITESVRTALKQSADETTPAIQAMQKRLDQMDRQAKERDAKEARERDEAEAEAMEEKLLGHVRSYGLALCKRHFSHLPEAQQKRAERYFDRELDILVSRLTDPGRENPVDVLDFSDEVVAGLSRRILKSLEPDFAPAEKAAQAAANDDARKKEPLTRGGASPDKTATEDDFDNMTPEQQEAYITKVAEEIAATTGASVKNRPKSDAPTY